ncbi:metal-dependent phosphohydrolase [Sporolactobacillus sp. THM7-7]|nr:metal-dependent phosphohydrolase [Sporolactobacillus sp. THM7-7]
MLVNTAQLTPGYVLRKNVYAKAETPLIRAGTVLNQVHLEFLNAFLIRQVDAEPGSAGRQSVLKEENLAEDTEDMEEKAESGVKEVHLLDEAYQRAVQTYRLFFRQWQSGEAVNIGEFRKAVMPLLAGFLDEPVFLVHQLIRRTVVRSRPDRSVSLGLLSAFMGKKMNFSQGDIYQIGLAGMLCDCGMAKLPPSLLNREDPENGGGRRLYESHVTNSYKMLKSVPTLKENAMLAVIQHHEREDGSGFPLHLTGERLSLSGKILAVCDSFLQWTAQFSEKDCLPQTLDALREASYGKLSGYLLDKLSRELMGLFIGVKVVLTDGKEGEITFIPEKEPTRPLIRLTNNQVIALSRKNQLKIDRMTH